MIAFFTKHIRLVFVALLSLVMVGCSSSPSAGTAPAAQVAVVQGYQDYSPSAVQLASSQGKDTAVFFHSKTCGSCAKLDANITANAGNIPSNIAILKADRDENQDLASQFGVDKYHTVSFLKDDGVQNVKGLFELTELIKGFEDAPAPTAYMPYTASNVRLAKADGKKVGIFFHSKTCGSCAKLDANITANAAQIPADVAIFKADRDSNQDLAKQYNVDKYHTVSFLGAGQPKNVKGLFELQELVTNFN